MNGDSQVSVSGVTQRYGRSEALGNVNLDLGRGVTGILGPKGAGKTTLLKLMATTLSPTAGALTLLGRDPGDARQRVEIRRRLGYVPQEVGLYENFTASEFVDYMAILKEHGERARRRAEVERVLHAVDLFDVRSKRIRKLSGGMRRRVVLAQALLGDPELLVLDEPTVGLDPALRLMFRRVISQQPEHRCTVLSTHLVEDVEALCDRVIVIAGGRITFDGTPPQLARLAAGHVWLSDSADHAASMSWRTGDGRHRHVGAAPSDSQLIEPTLHDGYLVLTGIAAATTQHGGVA